MSDLTIVVKGVQFPVHKFILAARSPVFQAMFHNNMQESQSKNMEICEISPVPFRLLLEYIYKFDVEITGESVMELLYLAKKYSFEELRDRCTKFVESNLVPENSCLLLMESENQNEVELSQKCEEVVYSSVERVVQLDDFCNLSPKVLARLVHSNKFVLPEIEIFNSCVKWAKKRISSENSGTENPENIRKEMALILPEIRFPLMQLSEISSTVYNSKILPDDVMLQLLLFVTSQGTSGKIDFSNEKRKQ